MQRAYPGIDPEIASLLPIHTQLKQLPRDIALPSTAKARLRAQLMAEFRETMVEREAGPWYRRALQRFTGALTPTSVAQALSRPAAFAAALALATAASGGLFEDIVGTERLAHERRRHIASVPRDHDDCRLRVDELEPVRLARVGRRRVDEPLRSQPIGDAAQNAVAQLARRGGRIGVEGSQVVVGPALHVDTGHRRVQAHVRRPLEPAVQQAVAGQLRCCESLVGSRLAHSDRQRIGGALSGLYQPNAKFTARLSQNDIIFRALREIAEGEQIFIDYEWDEADYTAFR